MKIVKIIKLAIRKIFLKSKLACNDARISLNVLEPNCRALDANWVSGWLLSKLSRVFMNCSCKSVRGEWSTWMINWVLCVNGKRNRRRLCPYWALSRLTVWPLGTDRMVNFVSFTSSGDDMMSANYCDGLAHLFARKITTIISTCRPHVYGARIGFGTRRARYNINSAVCYLINQTAKKQWYIYV